MNPRYAAQKPRTLCICKDGNSRSVACAWRLKEHYGIDALACGVRANSPETVRMLCQWAERIFVMDAKLLGRLPITDTSKVTLLDVGSDRWFKGFAPDLIEKCDEMLKRLYA